MRKYDLVNLFIVVLLALLFATLSGLGNAAHSVAGWYWIPFALNIVFYVAVCVILFKNNEKPKTRAGEGGGAALPTQEENEAEPTIKDKSQSAPKKEKK